MAEVKYNLGSLATIPSGAVIPFAGSTAPQGYLLCDGREVSRADYPYLFDAIGTTYGEGDGSTTFNLPNLQDKFVQGASDTNTIGTVKDAGLPNITGSISIGWGYASGGSGSFYVGNRGDADGYGNGKSTLNRAWFLDASRSNSIYGNSDTVQPPAVVMNYIIKY